MARITIVCTCVVMAAVLLGVMANERPQTISPGSFTDFRFYRLFGLRPQRLNNTRELSKRFIYDDYSDAQVTEKRSGNRVRGINRYWLGLGKRSYVDSYEQ